MKMRSYETLFILDPELPEDAIKESVERIKGLIEGAGGQVTLVDDWGRRELAYEIRHKKEGHYVLVRFTAPPEAPEALTKEFRMNDAFLRGIVVRGEEVQ